MSDTDHTPTDAGSASTPATTPPSAPVTDSFETAISAKLDALAAGKTVDNTPTVTAPPAQETTTDADDSTEDDSLIPSKSIKPPSDKLAPPEPESDEALESEIERTTKDWAAKEREAFKKKTYAIRDLKRQVKAYEAEKAQWEAAKTQGNPADALQQQLQEAQARLAEYESRQAVLDVQSTDVWKREVSTPLSEVDSTVTRLATKYSLDPHQLNLAINASGDDRSDKLSAAVAEMNPADQTAFFQAAIKRENISAAETRLRENAGNTLQQLTTAQREAQARAEQSAKQEWDAAVPRAWDRVAQLAPALQESEGADDWNAAVAKARTFASNVKYSDLGVTEQAEIMHRAAALPLVNSIVKALEEEVTTLRSAVAKYKGVTPAAGGKVASPTNAPRTSGVPDNASFEEAINAKMREAGF